MLRPVHAITSPGAIVNIEQEEMHGHQRHNTRLEIIIRKLPQPSGAVWAMANDTGTRAPKNEQPAGIHFHIDPGIQQYSAREQPAAAWV